MALNAFFADRVLEMLLSLFGTARAGKCMFVSKTATGTIHLQLDDSRQT